MQKSLPAAVFSCGCTASAADAVWLPSWLCDPPKALRSTDASPLSEVKRSVQERESGDAELLPRVNVSVQKGGKSETVSMCAVCLTFSKAVLRVTGFGRPV